MVLKVTTEYIHGETQIKVNGEYIAAIKGKLKDQKIPIVGNPVIGISKRFGNSRGHVWISVD